jgi:hypothetical protein
MNNNEEEPKNNNYEEGPKNNEYEKHPFINFSDSINRSMIGDLNNLIKGNLITRVIVVIIIAVVLYLLFS